MERKENNHQVVIRYKDSTHVFEKNRPGGITTKEGHSVHHHKTSNVTDHYGNIIRHDKKK